MQTNDLREIYKRLTAFAQKEYKEKRPISVTGYLIKQVKGISKSIPIINAYLTRQVVSFFILSNFKDNIRIYFFTRDGNMAGAENLKIENYGKFEKQLKKYTKKIFSFPHVSAGEILEERKTPHYKKIKKMRGVKVNLSQLESKFKRTFDDLVRKTGMKSKLPAISLKDSKLEDQRRFLSKKINNTIYYSLDILNSDLLNGIIIRDCLLELIPEYFGKIKFDLASYGTFLEISNSEKEIWLKKWKCPDFYQDFLKVDFSLEKIFKKLGYISNFFDESEKKEEFMHLLLKLLLEKINISGNLIASSFFNQLYQNKKVPQYLIKSFLFKFLENKKLIMIEEKIENKLLKCSQLIVQYKINEFRMCLNSLDTIPIGLNRLYSSILESIKPFEIHQEIIKDERSENQRIFIKVNFKNKSDLIFEILDFKAPQSSDQKNFSFPKEIPKRIYPFEEKSIQVVLRLTETSQTRIKPFKIKIRDDSENMYKLKSNSINL